jgi:hypothetical protein
MPRVLSFTTGPDDWKALLADPEKQWKTGYSARALAHCWESCDGLPPEVQSAFAASREPLLESLTPLIAVPEFKVPLPSGDRASQNDIFVLARSGRGAVVIMVEGKVEESFGALLGDWLRDASEGKRQRLAHLESKVGLTSPPPDVRYQRLHRAASAVITAEQFRAVVAVMLVHTFTQQNTGWTDYQRFLKLFGVDARPGTLQRLPGDAPVPLFAAWVAGAAEFRRLSGPIPTD